MRTSSPAAAATQIIVSVAIPSTVSSNHTGYVGDTCVTMKSPKSGLLSSFDGVPVLYFYKHIVNQIISVTVTSISDPI